MNTEKNHALENAIAGMASIVAMVGALECDYDRLEELREKANTPRFVAGWNMPGYMPDSEPAEFESANDAKRYVIDAIKRFEDEAETEEEAEALCHFAEEINLENDEFSQICGALVYWVTEDGFMPLNEEEAAELVELEAATNGCANDDEARQAIQDDPLSIEVRSAWQSMGETLTAAEFCILLTTGGPALRIVGDFDHHGETDRPRLEYQDWGTPWTELIDGVDLDALHSYCEQFYFGE